MILKDLNKFNKLGIFSTNHKDTETLYLSFFFYFFLLSLRLSLGLGIELATSVNGSFFSFFFNQKWVYKNNKHYV